MAFSPDGQTVLTGASDKTARLWNAPTGTLLVKPLKHEGEVLAVAFSPDGQTVLTRSGDKTARLWDTRTGAPLSEPLVHEDRVAAMAFSPDGQTVATASDDNTLRLWEARSGASLGEPLKHKADVVSVTFSPDGLNLLTGSGELVELSGKNTGEARLWDAHTGVPRGRPLKHEGMVGATTFSPNGQMVLTGSWDQTARLWHVSPPAISDRHNPQRLRLSVEVRTGKRLDENGVVQRLTFDEWNTRRLELNKLGGSCDRPTWGVYSTWKSKLSPPRPAEPRSTLIGP